MKRHEEKVSRIAAALQKHPAGVPLSLKKKAVSHEVPKPGDRRRFDVKIDISDLNDILQIDPENRICVAEPGVTFARAVRETMKYGLVPIIVPEFESITLGGAVAGCSIESMSYKYGGFHDTCLEYEVVTAKGEVLVCTPENERSLIFQMVHGTFGTVGIITRLTFRLLPAKKYVRVTYKKYGTLGEFKAAVWDQFERRDADFMDGIIHSPSEYALSLGTFVGEAPYVNRYRKLKVYYTTTNTRSEDYLKTEDYFFRYDQGVTNVGPKSPIVRFLAGWLLQSSLRLWIAGKVKPWLKPEQIPVIVDLFIPFHKADEFFAWYNDEIGYYPLWCVPYRHMRDYEWIASAFIEKLRDPLYLDLAIYGMPKSKEKNYHRLIELALQNIGGIKTLISENFYGEEEFWTIWNRDNFRAAKAVTDPDNLLRDLYVKTCRVMQGLKEEGPNRLSG
ncbi:MAG: FAD-binding oxidoreductase [Spirochaetales bacterium]|nr:MAG: FAD-binding oxidoreductase [Spirochaetales bacterium]